LFERQVFGDDFPIAKYDPTLIRYGEYRFVLDELRLQPGMLVLDLGCEFNIFMQYLAYRGVRIVGVDINPKVQGAIEDLKRRVETSTNTRLDIRFKADDATQLSLESDSVDAVVAISSIEHMFSKDGNGDQLAVASIARVLNKNGLAVITVPMSNGTPFHESPRGDARFDGPYRLYTPDMLAARFLSDSCLEVVNLKYLASSTPDARFSQMHFHQFWLQTLSAKDRAKWNWAQPILASIFNPIISAQEGEQRLESLNTALICLRKP
jgi:SAM-dependent methyltransferase